MQLKVFWGATDFRTNSFVWENRFPKNNFAKKKKLNKYDTFRGIHKQKTTNETSLILRK